MSLARQSRDIQQQVEETAGTVSESITDRVQENPVSAVALAVGAGLGVGVLVSMLISSNREKEYATYAQKIGRQVMSGVNSKVPNSLRDLFSN